MSEIVKTSEAATVELVTLAEQINAEHRAFVGSLKNTAEHGIRAGELLTQAKTKCKHGEWLPWLVKNFDGAPRTAQTYMQLYHKRDEIRAKTQNSAHLSIGGALKEIAATEEPEEKEVLEHWWHYPSFEEFNAACERYRRGEARATCEWDEFRWKLFAEEDRRVRGGWFREVAITELVFAGIRGDGALAEHWREELFRLQGFVRAVDLPPGRERFHFEDKLTYRQMHLTILELHVSLAEERLSRERQWQAKGDDYGTTEDVRLAEEELREAQDAVERWRIRRTRR